MDKPNPTARALAAVAAIRARKAMGPPAFILPTGTYRGMTVTILIRGKYDTLIRLADGTEVTAERAEVT